MKKLIFSVLIFILTIINQINPLLAADYQSPRTASLGGAGHAGPLLNDAIYLNPSFTSFLPSYSASAGFLMYERDDKSGKGRLYNVSVQDGRSPMFQAGAGYTLREDGSWINVGASRSLIKELGVGLGGKFFFNNTRLPSGQDLMLSFTGILIPEVQAALIIDNLLENNTSKTRNLYRTITLGMKANLKGMLLFYLDPHYVPNNTVSDKYGYNAGIEIVAMSDLFLRAGVFRASSVPSIGTFGRGYGVGIGWIGPRMSLDYALQRTILPFSSGAHVFGGTIYF